MKRTVWEVVPTMYAFGLLGWDVMQQVAYTRQVVALSMVTKAECIAYAESECLLLWRSERELSELRVEDRLGRIESIQMYGEESDGTN